VWPRGLALQRRLTESGPAWSIVSQHGRGDIIATNFSPSWKVIGHLAAISVIRTLADFFLECDMAAVEQREAAAVKSEHAAFGPLWSSRRPSMQPSLHPTACARAARAAAAVVHLHPHPERQYPS
jgi:hypothetical protein